MCVCGVCVCVCGVCGVGAWVRGGVSAKTHKILHCTYNLRINRIYGKMLKPGHFLPQVLIDTKITLLTCGPIVTWKRLSGESPPIKNLLGPLFLRKYSRAFIALSTSFCLAGSRRWGTDCECSIVGLLYTILACCAGEISPPPLGGREGRRRGGGGLGWYEGLLLLRRGRSRGSVLL